MIKNLDHTKYFGKYGIYIIFNKHTYQEYVGSTNNLYKRINGHLNKLRKNKHENPFLQNSWNKYGEDNFEVYVEFDYESIDIKKLRWIEDKLIEHYKTVENGFNLKGKSQEEEVKMRPEAKARMIERLSKKIESYNVSTGEVAEYSSGRMVFGHGGLSDLIKEKRLSKNCFWCYSGEMNIDWLKKCFYKMENPRPHRENAQDRSEVLDLETGIYYNSISDLSRTTTFKTSTFHTKLMRGDFGNRYCIVKQAVKKKI